MFRLGKNVFWIRMKADVNFTHFFLSFCQTTSLWVRVTTPYLTFPWAHDPGSPRIYWLLISQKHQRQPVKLTPAILKNTISFPGPDNFETCTGHLVFYFNLISPSLVSGNAKQKMRGTEWVVSHWKLPWLFPSQYTGRHHVVWGIHLQV